MPGLIQKSGYIKAGGSGAGNYMKYIATRDGVELLTGDGPATENQQQLIASLLHDFPDANSLSEYADYANAPTVASASAFISAALDENAHTLQESDKYMRYIATRPRAEKRGEHGLFSSSPEVSLKDSMKEVSSHQGPVWTFIYSLKREDAARLGYLKKPVKAQVASIVDELAQIPEVAECYEVWNRLRDEVEHYYKDKPREHLPLSQQAEFKAIKNMVIREAEQIRLGGFTFEDERMEVEAEEETEAASFSAQTMWQMAAVYREAKAVLYDDDTPESEKQETVHTLEQLWDMGFTAAAHQLGKCWRDGIGVLPDDEKAELWFRRSAEAGNDFSQYALGKLLQSERRIDEAVEWYGKAAEQRNQYANYRLGRLYLQGGDIPKDIDKAVEYLTASANQGNQYAQYTLGKLYLMGEDVRQDRELALHWLTASAQQGNEYAQFFLDRFDRIGNPNVLLSATKLLRHMGQIFRQNSIPPGNPTGHRMDRKMRARIREKKNAMGHKPDDHEKSQTQKRTMTMGM